MKNFRTVLLLISFITIVTSCKKKGCTDALATNFDSEAKKDDGSCVYPSNPVNNVININSPEQFSIAVDGTLVTGKVGENSMSSGYGSEAGPVNGTILWSSAFIHVTGVKNNLIIYKGNHSYPASNTDFSNYFLSNTYPYAFGTSSGISIDYEDNNTGKIYKSILGSQTGSSFQIVNKEDENTGGFLYVKYYAEFNCKLYNVNNLSEVITITNGKAVGKFANID